ncbi:MAG: hypothetical protein Q4G65_01995 [bacterium]|nr:hypothetical protein [bacterium]
MRRFIHDCWPLAAVVALTTILALQIPRKAIFFSPASVSSSRPFASFVTYDAATYESVMQKVRMSWQMNGVAEASFESRVDALEISEDVLELRPLELPVEFSIGYVAEPVTTSPVPLLPPSVADRSVLVPVDDPPDDRQETNALRIDLLSLPESLQSNE